MAEPKEVSIKACSVSDQAAEKDSLGFEPYVIAIADFLTEADTKPPLTLSIEGAWGSGKSSFMKQLQQEIERKSKEKAQKQLKDKYKTCKENVQQHRERLWELLGGLWKKTLLGNFGIILIGFLVFVLLILIDGLINCWKVLGLTLQIRFTRKPKIVWFNAWRHDKAEALWAAFALTFLEEISKKRHLLDISPLLGHIKLFIFRFKKEGQCDLIRVISQIVLTISATALILLFALFPFFPNLNRPPLVRQLGEYINKIAKVPEKQSDSSSNKREAGKNTSQQPGQKTASKLSVPPVSSSTRPSDGQSTASNSNQQDDSGEGDDKKAETEKDKLDWLEKISPWIAKFILGGAASGSAGLSVLYIWQQLRKAVGSPKKDLTEYLKAPDYDKQIAFIEEFHKDFKKIVDAYVGKGNKVYVFIDDLDRCEVPKSAELMQAINLMISNDPQLIFILGMDREKLAAGLAVKYREVIPYLSSGVKYDTQAENSRTSLRGMEYGYTFIEKFVQLPFQVPQPSKSDLEAFLSKLSISEPPKDSLWQSIGKFFEKPIQNNVQRFLGWIESFSQESSDSSKESPPPPPIHPAPPAEEPTFQDQEVQKRLETIKVKAGSDSEDVHKILTMVAPVLDWNPRRLKQFLNLFRLRAYVAGATGLFDEINHASALTLEQLGKFTAIGLKYPLLIAELTKDEQLLANLQKCVLNWQTYDSTTSYWGNETKLLELLRDRAAKPEYSLEKVNVKQLLQVSPQVHPLDRVSLSSEKGVDYRNLRELLKAGRWREANLETEKVMRKVIGRENHKFLGLAVLDFTYEDLDKFPCADLRTIDQLWVTASNRRFGFSIQKQICQECARTTLHGTEPAGLDPSAYIIGTKKFSVRVGWLRKDGESVSSLTYDTSAPLGHLPTPFLFTDSFPYSFFFCRIDACEL